MVAMKTAISLDQRLLERIDQAAEELDLPRSRLLARAAEEFLAEHETRKLLERLDRAYADQPTTEEKELLERHRGRRRQALEGTW